MSSPLPRLHMTFALRFYPYLATARRFTDNLMNEILQRAWRKFYESNSYDDQPTVTSAADLLVGREAKLARKHNRPVMYHGSTIRDEFMCFYIAGHETTPTLLCRAVKRLTEHQDVHWKLLKALRLYYKAAAREKRPLTPAEIVESNISYLDAFVEESHRPRNTIPPPFGARKKSESTSLSAVARARKQCGVWHESDIPKFKPEQFLVSEKNGGYRFLSPGWASNAIWSRPTWLSR